MVKFEHPSSPRSRLFDCKVVQKLGQHPLLEDVSLVCHTSQVREEGLGAANSPLSRAFRYLRASRAPFGRLAAPSRPETEWTWSRRCLWRVKSESPRGSGELPNPAKTYKKGLLSEGEALLKTPSSRRRPPIWSQAKPGCSRTSARRGSRLLSRIRLRATIPSAVDEGL